MTLSALDRKLLRDLWRLKWQVLAIALLVACGVAVTTMAYSAQKSLSQAQAKFYADTRFADVFASARRAPQSLIGDIARIDGVLAVDGRIMETGLMRVPGQVRPAVARVISLPDNERTALNKIILAQGRMPDPERLDEAVAGKSFLDASGVAIGDRLTTVIGGRALTFRIVGSAYSPEYVFTPAPGSMIPDDAHQGVFWAPRKAVEHAAGYHGAFNSLAVDLAANASPEGVRQAIDLALKPFGGVESYGREDQISHAFLDAELKELSRSAAILPPIFLLVAAALVHLVMTRLVQSEREQIGLLKAFGYGDFQVASPYLRLAGAVGLIGVAAGGLGGALMGAAVLGRYREYFRFPSLDPAFHLPAFLIAAAASLIATLAGSLMAVRRAAALSPAAAMQPLRPTSYRPGVLDRLVRGRWVDEATRIIVRNLERFPFRAGFACVGMAASLALLVGAQFVFGSLDYVVEQAYYRTQRWSFTVGFAEARGPDAIADLRRLPGVYAAEPVRVVAAELSAGGLKDLVQIRGLEPDALLNRPLDAQGRPIAFTGRSLILSESLAARLGVNPGDHVDVELRGVGRVQSATLPVSAVAEDFSGYSAYITRRALNRLANEGDVANAAQLLAARDQQAQLYEAISLAPQIIAAASRDDTVSQWRNVMMEAFRVNIRFYVAFAGAIAFGVAYNTSRIALSERSRDLATLQVLGFERRECAFILLGELLLLTLLAIPLGLIGGNGLSHALVIAFARDEMRLPLVMTPRTYAVSLTAFLAAVALAALPVGRRIWRLDLVTALKTRE